MDLRFNRLNQSSIEEDLQISGVLDEEQDYEIYERELTLPTRKLEEDIIKASSLATRREIRYQVKEYYRRQNDRKRLANQVRALDKVGEPHALTDHNLGTARTLEERLVKVMDIWTDNHPVGTWTKSLVGVGPIISAGMLAHIDITKAPYPGHIWSFAGYNPTMVWEKGQLRPFNLDLKVLLYNFGQCAIKTQNREGAFYGKYYQKFRAVEDSKNANGEYAETAADILRRRNYSHDTLAYAAYSRGELPKAHLLARAARKTIKLFISHWHYVMYVVTYGVEPEMPYAIVHLGHKDYVPPPNWPMVDQPKRRGRWPSMKERIKAEVENYTNGK